MTCKHCDRFVPDRDTIIAELNVLANIMGETENREVMKPYVLMALDVIGVQAAGLCTRCHEARRHLQVVQ